MGEHRGFGMQNEYVEASHDDLVAGMLSLVVEASADMIDTMTLCSLLQLNKACNRAIRGSRARHSITIKASTAVWSGLCAWLPKHAGLVSELRLQSTCASSWRRDKKQERTTGMRLSRELTAALQAAAAAAGLGEASTAVAAAGSVAAVAAPSPMQLLLTGFHSQVFMEPALLQGLPAASLTCLSLDDGHSFPGEALCAALQHLSNLKSLRLVASEMHSEGYDDWTQDVCRALPSLSALTHLEVGPLLSGDVSSFPTALLHLKLQFVAAIRDSIGRPDDVDVDSSGEEVDWYETWLDGEEREQLMKAAHHVDLTHLPLLQACELMRSHPAEDYEVDMPDYTAAATVELAAPQLTLLLLYGNFGDALGLQQPSKLKVLALSGCAITVTRIAELVSGSPSLAHFYFDGYEHNCHAPWLSMDGCPILRIPIAEQRQLAAALGGSTQLTALLLDGVSDEGLVEVGNGGSRSTPSRHSHDEEGTSGVNWGEHLKGLRGLKDLELFVGLHEADLLALTSLTSLTFLQMHDEDFDRDGWLAGELKRHLTNLTHDLPAPFLIVRNAWGFPDD